jgi:hypothetical protein
MRRIFSLSVLSSALVAAVVSAQSTTPSSSGNASPKSSSFIGCVEQSQRTATTESGAFVLSTPTPSTATAGMRKGTPDDPASNARANVPPIDAGDTGQAEGKIANVYVLDGSTAELSKHVGHKVEVTGTLKNTGTGPSASPASDPAGVPPAVPHLQVSAVRMVSESCSGN